MNNKLIKTAILSFLLLVNGSSFSQETAIDFISEKENLILKEYQHLLSANTDVDKRLINKNILSLFSEVLKREESFLYNFSKLKNVGILSSNDERVRIYTWNLVFNDGSFEYFGFIQHQESKNDFNLIQLFDDSENIKNPERASLGNKNWFGALYYELIEVKAKNKTYYTLLAWDGNNLFSNKKLVDVLYFSKAGQARFGSPIFRRNGRLAKRIIFEYSKTASMALRYDKNLEAIVFDRLVPSKPTFEGSFQFYVPDVTTDGLVLAKDKHWDFVDDIATKNPKSKGLQNRKTEK